MDVRCEKCQTEYELDEARLKPSGVTVKCTNCGHMFKIRKRAITNVGLSVPASSSTAERKRSPTSKPPVVSAPSVRAPSGSDSMFGEDTAVNAARIDDAPTTVDKERQWLIRLENGEQKSCRELAILQQWIVAGIVTRESLISRTGKTWKRLGDIGELSQYFSVADETRAHRNTKPTGKTVAKKPAPAATMLGLGGSMSQQATSAGGTILPDDDDDTARNTGEFPSRGHTPRPQSMPPPPPVTRTPPLGTASTTKAPPIPPARPAMLGTAPTEMVQGPVTPTPPPVVVSPRRPLTQPPPPPPKRSDATPPPVAPQVPAGNRATAMWANDAINPKNSGDSKGPTGPRGGKISAVNDEPAFAGSFAGRVRTEPTDSASVFSSGKIKSLDDDDDALPARRGSRAGTLIALIAIIVIGGSAATIYAMMRRGDRETAATKPPADAGSAVAIATPIDASVASVTPIIDAGSAVAPPPALPFAQQRADLASDVEASLMQSLTAIGGQEDAPGLAMRAHISCALAQALHDRAGLLADKRDGDKLRANSDKVTLEAASLAQRALKAAPDDPTANLAMAEVMRLQKKPAKDIKRYLDTARGKLDPKADPQLAREIALADALVIARDGKLDDARAAFAAIDQGDGAVEASHDVRARWHEALALFVLGKPNDAKPLVDQVGAFAPEHAGAKALEAKLSTLVAQQDPLPPEEHRDAGVGPGPGSSVPPGPGSNVASVPADARTNDIGPGPAVPTGDYNKLVQQANKLAESNCTEAMKVFQRALDQNPAGADALTGIGYCQLDAKQFSSAYSKFSAALAVDPRHEGALSGIAEMYTQQGKKDKAIEAWKAYQAIYPGSPKAQRQLDRLSGITQSPTPPQPGSDAPTPPPVTPTPAPVTTPGSDGN